MQVASYFASLGFVVNQASVIKADKVLTDFEFRLKKLSSLGTIGGNGKGLMGLFNKPLKLNITGFDIDQSKLNLAIGNALDVASNKVTFEISRFSVNQRNLQAALSANARGIGGFTGRGGIGQGALSEAEWNRREGERNSEWASRRRVMQEEARIRHQRSLELAGLRGGARVSGIAGGAAGYRAGGLLPGSFLGGALALGLGGYGLSNLNERNQQVVSAQLQTSAVVQQAGGTAEQGKGSFEYLRNEGQRIGFNYLDASQDYNKLISGLTGSGIGLKESQKVFSGFAELARVNKLDKTTQNRLFRALSQVAGKGKLMSEELNIRLAA